MNALGVSFLKIYFYLCVCTQGDQKRASDLLEIELQVVVSYTDLGSLRGGGSLNEMLPIRLGHLNAWYPDGDCLVRMIGHGLTGGSSSLFSWVSVCFLFAF